MIALLNVHERPLPAPPESVGALLDSLGCPDDRLWPPGWPELRFQGPPAVGVPGGHGPISYVVSHYVPGRWIRFRFTGPRGFEGFHEFSVESLGEGRSLLRHTLVVRPYGWRWLAWPVVVRPVHDAVFGQVLERAERALTGRTVRPAGRGWYARVLRGATARLAPGGVRKAPGRLRKDEP
ncbi:MULTISPECIES: SRPBCC family protein [Streptomyces]|uniref:SRPBCC family protein n=1 Tax=Streptomyces olivaceus TaxID=47716 RepID=A0ABS7WDG8_STROV|nr:MULTISPECIES: SRPBCC family protein [Streptomyces]MBZ6085751.1 SRPBCC family protein [Streptomyces olivaceus]MBZ6092241.1 SRPBCC family protein [Streptomyces olivaceus]MBZ6099249.1 SRPBCC family protein [Streptomyces olivaceus]MBZ6109644.1 SRPBCC family protein [Streptomyces olivaceus]MBZ6120227.1 SRPBCC family protein [Streptomyces olivaceus]